MNTNIQNIINSFYKNNNTIYESYSVINSYLVNEEYHIVNEFDKLCNYIISNINLFKLNINTYTGWNWHSSTKKCSNDNNENSGNPIYICVTDKLSTNTFGYFRERDLNKSQIIIDINQLYIGESNFISKLKHEFTHVRSSFAKSLFDPLQNKKKHNYKLNNIEYYINRKNKTYSLDQPENTEKIFLFNNSFIDIVQNIFYLISKTEQEARINQTYSDAILYLQTNEENINTLDRHKLINILIGQTIEASLVLEFKSYVDLFSDQLQHNQLKPLLCLGYYLNLHKKLSVTNLSLSNIIKIFNVIDKQSDDEYYYEANQIYNYIENEYGQYRTKIIDTLWYAIKTFFEK